MLPNLTVVPMREINTVAGGTAAFGIVDTKGYDFAKLIYATTKATAASSQDYFDFGHCDTLATAYTDTGVTTICTGTTDLTVVAESTDYSNTYVFNVDCRGRKRYLVMRYESDATHLGAMLAVLGRKEDGAEATVATTAHGTRNIANY